MAKWATRRITIPVPILAKGEKGVAARLQEAADNLMSAGKTLFGKI